MTSGTRGLAMAVWNVSELVEALTPADLADLSLEPVILHMQTVAAELVDRAALVEAHDVVL